MTGTHSIFFNEWQSCLRAHYIHVLRISDAITEPTLRQVLLQTGLTEADIETLYQEALALGPLDPYAALKTEIDADAETEFEGEYAGDEPVTPSELPDEISTSEDEDDFDDDDLDPPDINGQLSMF